VLMDVTKQTLSGHTKISDLDPLTNNGSICSKSIMIGSQSATGTRLTSVFSK
jgi:hypothetical protein